MFGRSRRMAPIPPVSDSSTAREPWKGTQLQATWTTFPTGRKGTAKPGVLLTCGAIAARMHAGDLLKLVDRKIGTTTSMHSEPVSFLTWKTSAPPSSLAGEAMQSLPDESLVLLVAPMDAPAPAVLSGAELEAFSQWVRALPS